jgi:hypothetical protein
MIHMTCPKCGRTGPAKHEGNCMNCDTNPPSKFHQFMVSAIDALPATSVVIFIIVVIYSISGHVHISFK